MSEVPAELPIFPLGGVVLLPGGLLPLHIFEPRYRAMIAACLAGDRMLGIARLRPGFEASYEGRPPVVPICGIGRIVACEELADGRYNILVQGVARAVINREQPPAQPYRVACVSAVADAVYDATAMQARCDEFLEICHRMKPHLGESGDALCGIVASCADPRECLDMVASALIRDPDVRQTLLETLCPLARATVASGYVSQLLAQLQHEADDVN
ncbi:MAG: LON peptidase substrate-binding domain-containing protein [Myxococcales bacterium]|nr:LON peptidase substrate-binding domain-containing protein [Myxococcales bacterium]